MMSPPVVLPSGHSHHRRRSGNLIALVILALFGVVVTTQRQAIFDFGRLYNYQAPADIVALADATTMTDKSRHVFYVNHPEVQNKTAFNSSCPNNGGEQTIILGCYKPKQDGIFVFQVSDPQLKGVQEVTTAHEMLHAAYDRLGTKDRTKVDAQLNNYYSTLKDPRLIEIFKAYQKSEPNDLTNEMHSIFGTEVANLPGPLEDYYRQYFKDRQTVVAFASAYQSVFSGRKDQIDQYDQQLKTLKVQIEANQAQLVSLDSEITSRRQQLNRQLASGNNAAYNAQVDSFNALVNTYNNLIANTKNKIANYNRIVETRNALAVETQNLAQELNSNSGLQTQSAQ